MRELLWQRPAAITIAFFIFHQLKRLLSNFSNFIPMLSVIFVTGISLQSLVLISLAYVLVILVAALLNYRYFAYAVGDDALHVRSGIFNRQQLTLKFARIQQAEIKQPWYFRPFQLTIIGVDSAGSSGKEIEIPGLTVSNAQQLRGRLLASKVAAQTPGDEPLQATTDPDQHPERLDYQQQFSLRELMRGGLMDNKIWLLLAVLVYPLSQLNVFEDHVAPWLEQQTEVWNQTPAVTVTVTVIVTIVLLFVLGLVMTLITDYGLSLKVAKGRFYAQAGLLTIRSLSFRYHKLQRVVFKQNLRGRLLKRWSLTLNQLQPSKQPQSQQQVFRLPVLDRSIVTTLRQHLRLPDPEQLSWQRLPFAALLGPSLVLALIAMTISWWSFLTATHTDAPLRLITGLWLLLQIWLIARWRCYRYAYQAQWLVLRQGVLGQREHWYPLHKIQQINVDQSPWQRLLGLVSLQLIGAAGQERISWQPAHTAYALQQQWLTNIHSSQQSWM
jgi:putative membrane protein